MRRALFKAYAAIAAYYILFCNQLTSWICRALFWVNSFQRELIAAFNFKMLRFIHPESLREAEEKILQAQQAEEDEMTSIELQLLVSAQNIRDHAKDGNFWTDQHSEALELVSEALIETCGWDPDSVNQYMQEVVETIDDIEWR